MTVNNDSVTKKRKNAAYQEKELFALDEKKKVMKCIYDDFEVSIANHSCILDFFVTKEVIEQHFVLTHAKEPNKNLIMQWLKANLPLGGKLRIMQKCIDDLEIIFFRAQYPYQFSRYSTAVAVLFNQILESGLIVSTKKGNCYYYELASSKESLT